MDVGDEQIANLRAESRAPGDDARLFAERRGRTARAAFTDRWERGAVTRKRTGIKAIQHPAVGLLRLAFETLELPDADRQRLVVYLPADSATSAGLDRLAGRQLGCLAIGQRRLTAAPSISRETPRIRGLGPSPRHRPCSDAQHQRAAAGRTR